MYASSNIARRQFPGWLHVAAIAALFIAQILAAAHAATTAVDNDHDDGLCVVCHYAVHCAKAETAPPVTIVSALLSTGFKIEIPMPATLMPSIIQARSARGPPQHEAACKSNNP